MTLQKAGRKILLHGLILVLVGLAWGLVVPHTPYPRLALGAHIQFVFNGMLLLIIALLLLTLTPQVGSRSLRVLVLSAWLIWPMVLSESANAWWGTAKMLPISGAQAGVSGGAPWQEAVVTLTHIGAGLGILIAWALLLVGFMRQPVIAPDPA